MFIFAAESSFLCFFNVEESAFQRDKCVMQDQEILQLIPRLRPLAFEIGRQFFGNTEDAEDVAQDTCLRLWAARSHIDVSQSMEPLMARIAKNVCVSMWRKRSVGNEADIVSDFPSDDTSPQALLEEREDAIWVEHRLRALPEYLQRVLRLKQEEGLTTEQIAEILGTDPHSVQTLISKARRQLMNELKRRYRK